MYDIIFISYKEANAEQNWKRLIERFPTAQRVDNVKGIHWAHIAAATKSLTKMFWVVDGDAEIKEDFDFSYQIPKWDNDTVHVWRSENPVNGLVYGYGGVKLLPKEKTLFMDITSLDMTTSISDKLKVMSDVSNITAFNTDEFSTWRSAFRECAKLASKTIQGQNDEETESRLQAWLSPRRSAKFSNWAEMGSAAGRDYGMLCSSGAASLKNINNYEWLKEQFDKIKQDA